MLLQPSIVFNTRSPIRKPSAYDLLHLEVDRILGASLHWFTFASYEPSEPSLTLTSRAFLQAQPNTSFFNAFKSRRIQVYPNELASAAKDILQEHDTNNYITIEIGGAGTL